MIYFWVKYIFDLLIFSEFWN